ncbi:hypothetical protein [Halobacillus yeomjeoni]|uniref:Uncharacterized protein n=1 Tax=Halobacillus yeomjeoni TaxID=311194 RepID=A0A931HTK7_9BACI|nr:hypothetical protein [Halobacillus yeomjeoni]MBH0229173.1 hypothetical protein [Halobacillus yeomjeoni]
MNYFLVYSVFTAISLPLISMIMGKRYRTNLTEHAKMVIAMFCGTSSSLLLGVSLAAIYYEHLFHAMVIGLGAGLFLGGLQGSSLGLLPTFEGATSGFMGGMMGVMLGAMLPLDKTYLLVQLFIIFALCSLMVFGIFVNLQADKSKVNGRWFIKPLFISILIVGYILAGNYLSLSPINETPVQSHHHKH